MKQEFGIEVTPIEKDLFKSGAAKEIYETVQQMGITVDTLVNDAGQGEWGRFVDTDLQRDLDIIQLNISSLVALTKYFLRDMVTRNEGRIMQVGSEAGTTPAPLLSIYAATKASVLSFSAALAHELKDTSITITALLPGATDTDFFHKPGQEDTIVYQETELAKPEDVAKDGYEALKKGESKIVSGAKTKMHVFMSDLLGTKLSAANMGRQNKPSKKGRKKAMPEHEASLEERQHINSQSGKNDEA